MKAIEAEYEAQDEAKQDVITFAKSLQTSLFATRENVADAYLDLLRDIDALPAGKKGAVMSSVQILINTIAEEVQRKAEWR